MAHRYDIGSLRPAQRLPDGRLRVDGHLTRAGVFSYRNADGSVRREYRPDAEVFRPSSLATFADVPVTDDHPPEMLTADNARSHAVGFVSGEPRRDGDHIAARIVVMDAATIAKVEAGKAELSCGYECDLDSTPGVTPDGERYDAVQTNIRGNHVAIVEVARAGRSARMRLDAADMIPSPAPPIKESLMDPKEYAAALADLAIAKARADKAEADLAAAGTAAAAALAAVEARAVGAERDLAAERKARKDAVEADRNAIRARLQLEDTARKHLGAEVKLDELSDRDVMAAVVTKLDGDDLTGAHEEFVRGLFIRSIARADEAAAAVDGIRTAAEGGRTDAGTDASSKAHAEMVERNRNLWIKK